MTRKEKRNDVTWLEMAFVAEIIGLFSYVVQTYMDLFLLYLISQFSKRKEQEQILDKVLGRKVPAMVYIQNQKLINDAKLGNEKTPNQLRKMAKSNEQHFSTLVKTGAIPPRIESITYEYININKSNEKAHKSYVSSVRTFSSGDSLLENTIREEIDKEE